jgi:hypothetical protein
MPKLASLLPRFSQVHTIEFRCTPNSTREADFDALALALVPLQHLPSLTQLSFWAWKHVPSKCIDEIAAIIGRCARLRTLDLTACKVSDAGVQNFANLEDLRQLDLDNCRQLHVLPRLSVTVQDVWLDKNSPLHVLHAQVAYNLQGSKACAWCKADAVPPERTKTCSACRRIRYVTLSHSIAQQITHRTAK